jgi:hypothetical protein
MDEKYPHDDYKGITEMDEHWLADKLFEITGIKFRKISENKFDIDLESVEHYPKIYVECEGSHPSTWPKDCIRPPKWTKGVTVPLRKHKYFGQRINNGVLTFYIKFNHFRNQCMITDGETIIDHFKKGNIIDINYNKKTPHMDKTMIRLDWDDVYYGFENARTFINKSIDNRRNSGINRIFELKDKK